MSARPVRVVDFIVQALERLGVRQVFGVGGANIEDLYDALYAGTGAVRGIVAKHEFCAATMAEGYARVTGGLGVVASTSGGGAMNLAAGLAEAFASRIPVLALVGQAPTGLEGRGAFQDQSGRAGSMDAHRLFSTISRFCARVDSPAAIAELLPRAVAAAQAGPGGPAVLLLPKDVQQDDAGGLGGFQPLPRTPAPLDRRAGDEAVATLARALAEASPILVIAGDGVARAHARVELARLAAVSGAWVAVAPDAKDVFDNRDRRFVGVTGHVGHANVADCLARAAVCLVVGTRLPRMAGGNLGAALADKRVICLDPEPPFIEGSTTGPGPIFLNGDLREEMQRLTGGLRAAGQVAERSCQPHEGPRPLPMAPAAGAAIGYRAAVEAIEAALPGGANVVSDAGNSSAGVVHHLRVPTGGRFIVAHGMGAMGHSFGAGLGAAFANGRRTYVLAGDGAFYMHGLELHTAVEHDLPVTTVLFNNNAHAMCLTREQLYYGGRYSYNRFRAASLGPGLAAMFPALPVRTAHSGAELHEALVESNQRPGPAVIDVDFDADELPPFVPFLEQAERLGRQTRLEERL